MLKIQEFPDLRARKHFLNAPRAQIEMTLSEDWNYDNEFGLASHYNLKILKFREGKFQ